MSGESHRGGSFAGVDFSGQDLRGCDFADADLRGAVFSSSRLGVAPSRATIIFGVAILAAIGAGLAIGFAVDRVRARIAADEWDEVAGGGSIALMLALFVALLIWRGFDAAVRVLAVAYVIISAANIIANLLWEQFEPKALLSYTVLIVFVTLAISVGTLGRLVGGVFGTWSIAVVAALGGLATGRADGGVAGVIVALALVAISKRALKGDPRDYTLRRLAHRMVRRWGTRFDRADLSGADFRGADASACVVEGAILTDVRWDPASALPVDVPPSTNTSPR